MWGIPSGVGLGGPTSSSEGPEEEGPEAEGFSNGFVLRIVKGVASCGAGLGGGMATGDDPKAFTGSVT